MLFHFTPQLPSVRRGLLRWRLAPRAINALARTSESGTAPQASVDSRRAAQSKRQRTLLLALLTALAAAGFHASAAAAAPDPFTCAGYPEARVFIEAQSWWRTTPGEIGSDHGHGHFGACIPLEKSVSGIVHIDWVAKLHENPGFVKQIWSELSVPGNDSLGGKSLFYDGTGAKGYACLMDCTFVIPTNYDTRVSPYDGRQELQTRMLIREPDGNVMRPSVRFPLYLANGKTVNSNLKAKLNTYGWYTGALYAWVDLWSGVPTAPISGVWRIGDVSFRAATNDNSVTHWFVSVDPDLHALSHPQPYPGVVYYDRATSCVPKTKGCSGPRHTSLQIDTTILANGPHKLFLRTDAEDGRGSTNSGAMVVPFTVRN